jgi:hypothetical protein
MTLTPEQRDQAIASTLLTLWRIISSMRMAIMPMEKLIRVEWAIRMMPPEIRDTIRKEVDIRMKMKNTSPGNF